MPVRKPTASSHKSINTVRIAVAGIFLTTAVIIMSLTACHSRHIPYTDYIVQENDGQMAHDIQRLSEEDYNSVFISMHSTANFHEEDFITYRGLNTLVTSHTVLNIEELSQYLECIFLSGNTVSDLYICPDPEFLWAAENQDTRTWSKKMEQNFYSHIESHPEISFSILLPFPYISYWLESDDDKLELLFTLYHTLIEELYTYPNVKIFFPGAENWLTLNPDNYMDTLFDTNEVITESILLHTFCDGDYAITPENEEDFWATLRDTIAHEKTSPTCRGGLSDWCLVFFGDSIFGNYPGSFSIPGYVTGLSDAVTFNYAVSGTSASSSPNADRADFPHIIDGFLEENATLSGVHYQFTPPGNVSAAELADKKLCFIINYGFNDYFEGAPVENPQNPYDVRSFKGGLRTCIGKLQSAFPDARYILVSPTHTSAFNFGTDINSENGGGFHDYIKAISEIAAETGAFLIDNYNESVITEQNLAQYLGDGVHPNETGRLVLADRIIRFIEQEMR